MTHRTPEEIARNIIREWHSQGDYPEKTIYQLISQAITQERDKSRCPCGGIILADTDDCTVPLCWNCAEEIVKAMGVK